MPDDSEKPYPAVDESKCNGCETCVGICPFEVFEMKDKKAKVMKPKECIGCHACSSQCPVEAIKIVE